ncbi:hypothetical protein TruAng_001616 [Truncatella angustata]|nr:hypothetical protein TruAng_001616 [Truncatella angustata]
MAPASSVTSGADSAAPPLPPRPNNALPHIRRRPVNTAPLPASSLTPTALPASPSLTQTVPLRPPRPEFSNPGPGVAQYADERPGSLEQPIISNTSVFSGPQATSSMPAPHGQASATTNSQSPQSSDRRSSWSSTFGIMAKAALLESLAPGMSSLISRDQAPPALSTQPPTTPLSGNQVIVNDVSLGQADIMSLQALLGAVLPGSYWYDRRSGAYGMIGGPCSGFLSPGLPLGCGQLAENASGNTGTGVFINGRQIHSVDVVGLQSAGTVVMPGRWWVNGDGTYGAEGSPLILGRLNLRASASASGGAGGSHSWSTSMGHYGGSDGQGFSYVGGPGWSYYSG